MQNSFLVLAISFGVAAHAISGPPKTLAECYSAALKRSETIANQQESIRQAELSYRAAVGTVLPTVSGFASYQVQQTPSSSVGSQVFPSTQPLARLTATVPLFQGLREFAAMREGRGLIEASTADKKQAEISLYVDTATSFFTVLSLERDVINAESEIGLYEKRIAELSELERIGRSRASEVLTARAQKLALEATLEQTRALLVAQREVLAFVTGFEPSVTLKEVGATPAAARDVKTYIDRVEQRPDVIAEKARARATDAAIGVASAAHYPSLNAQADYFAVRAGALADVHWDVILSLSVPIFNGGIIQSQVSQAISRRDQAESTLSRVRRQAIQQVRTLHSNYTHDRSQWEMFQQARKLAERSFKDQTRDYKRGLVSNLDVLTALSAFQSMQRSQDRARYAMEIDFESLEAAAAFK